MRETIILSTAYFPPAEYFSLMAHSREVQIEYWENYHKQTYRNRCVISGANGILDLIVPVKRGSFHKTAIKDLEIDDSRPWRDQHLRSIVSAYATAPFYEYLFDPLKDVIIRNYKYLIDLNMAALLSVVEAIDLDVNVKMTEDFFKQGVTENDFRYSINPKKPHQVKGYSEIPFTQVFSDRYGFVPGLSIIDTLLNNGPGTKALLLRSLEPKI